MSERSLSHLQLPITEEFSTERVRDHVLLMIKFRRIIQDIKYPKTYTEWFPESPNKIYNQKHELAATWRVQALLMNAEVRYSLYLRFLRDWINQNHEKAADKENWPLPPW